MTKRELSTGTEKETQRILFKMLMDLVAKVLFYDRNWGIFIYDIYYLCLKSQLAHLYYKQKY